MNIEALMKSEGINRDFQRTHAMKASTKQGLTGSVEIPRTSENIKEIWETLKTMGVSHDDIE